MQLVRICFTASSKTRTQVTVKWCVSSLIWVKGTGFPLRWRICLNGKEIMISNLLLPTNEKEKMKIKSQLLISGTIQSPIWFLTYMFLSNFWTVKYSTNTLTHKISMKAGHSQTLIYSDLSSLGNSRDLFGWLNTEKVFPSKYGYLLTLFFCEILVTLLKANFLRKSLSFPSRFHF